MISLKENLKKIGLPKGTIFSYKNDFASRPNSLRQAIISMDAPNNWVPTLDIHRDDYWTDEVQGVAWDGENWIFSCNANQSKPGHNDKAIYVFKGGSPLGDDKYICRINYKDVPHPIAGTYENDDHWGQLTCYNGFVYVAHYWASGPKKDQSNIIVFRNNGGFLEFDRWIELGMVRSSDSGEYFYPEFQAINPWDGLLYTCKGGPNTREFYAHYRESTPDGKIKAGEWTGKVLKFSGGEKNAQVTGNFPNLIVIVDLPSNVQGACFSPNGHLYIACDARLVNDTEYKAIAYFSALNGQLMGIIPVLAKEGGQELEGVCFGNVSRSDGQSSQIHAVLLENRDAAIDNIYFKSYSADLPDVI
jgi:hypothetical protein